MQLSRPCWPLLCNETMFTLSKKQTFSNYTVAFPIKEGGYAETYRVKDSAGKNYFLKLIDLAKLNSKQFDENDNVIEVEIVRQLNHPNVMHYVDGEELMLNGRRMAYVVSDFVSGETLEQNYIRESGSNPYKVRDWMLDVLSGLQYLHSQTDPIIHNELTPQNVMLDAVNHRAVIIDFGHARRMSDDRRTFDRKGLSPYFLAPETAGGLFSPQSDLFSVGVMAYRLLYGQLPWNVKQGDNFEDRMQIEREKPLKVMSLSNIAAPDGMVETIAKALSVDPDDRFKSADEMARALRGELKVNVPTRSEGGLKKEGTAKPASKQKEKTAHEGNGFADVAGMRELKAQLQRDVIDFLCNPEKYKSYGLTLPNGMLLYGPPGCGKTFFAKKLAEEVGFNFVMRTPSDLKSRYVNATQENIAAMFKEAEEKAPTIIFIDEINELLPKRTGNAHEMSKSAVNEMLAQMDRTGERGIFVIGATNLPDEIDEAMLRTGRLEKRFFVGPPDEEARCEMFEMNLKNRRTDFGIDFERLASLTEGYVSSDIRFIVDEAARAALTKDESITMALLEESIRTHPSSIRPNEPERRRIGF